MTQKQRSDWESIAIFALALAVNLFMVWIVLFRMRIFAGDAMARSLQAWTVIYGAEPKLSNIGFVWPPLHQMMQLPLILIPLFRENGLSGNVITAFAGAGTCVFLHAFLRTYKIGWLIRYVLIAAFAFNPMILFYAVNGMSEMLVIFFVIFSFYCYRRYEQVRYWPFVAMMGFAMGLAFLTKIELIGMAGFFGLALFILELADERRDLQRTQATLLVYGVPIVFMVTLWTFANWLIMGNALYFVNGAGASFQAKYLQDDPALLPFLNTPRAMMVFVASRVWQMSFPYWILVLLLLAVALVRRDTKLFNIFILGFGIALSPALFFLFGSYLPYLRYYILAIPGAFVLAAPLMRQLSFFRFAEVALSTILIFGAAYTANAMQTETAFGEKYFVYQMAGQQLPWRWTSEKQIADYITQHATRRSILSDTLNVPDVMFFTGEPWLFVLPSDSDFGETLKNPYGKVDYVLVPQSSSSATLNAVLKAYPELLDPSKTSWAKVEFEAKDPSVSEGFRLYRVIAPPSSIAAESVSTFVLPPEVRR